MVITRREAALALLCLSVAAPARGWERARPARALTAPAGLARVAFPRDPAVIDAKRDLGAKGDGRTDDTDALQRGLDMSCGIGGSSRVLYLPNGVYRVTRGLVVSHPVGPWVYGETRDGVVLRLDAGVQGVTAVLRTHPRETGPTSADWFMRNLRNFTVDAGDNPNTDGIRYYATNSGILRNVRVVGRGRVGVNAGFLDQSGPNLVQDVLVEGFETGILTQWIWGQTLSRVTIRNCRRVGLHIDANAVGVEGLVVENTPLPVLVELPNDWGHWSGVAAIVGARLTGGDPSGPAIRSRGVLYARNVRASGFRTAIESSTPGGNAPGPVVAEYLSHPAGRLFEDAAPRSLALPIRREPDVPWETNPSRWVCANDFGAVAGDNLDDTAAIQRAIDAAAAARKTTVYLRGVGGPDPNWYTVDGEVRVHGSVRHVLGLGFGRVLGGPNGRFVVDDRSAPVVKFQSIDSFGGPPVQIINRSSRSAMVVESCGVRIVGEGSGDIFATDCPSLVDLRRPGQRMWARHLNPEGTDDVGLVRNAGCDLWILGMKCEGKGVRIRTAEGGRTELLGAFLYSPGDIAEDDARPLFDVVNASATFAGVREISFGARTFPVKVRERRGAEERVNRDQGWIGWSLFSAWTGAPAGRGR
ncbi:MAG TPA: glycosyl hydrolase family 28-related protein [Chthonomonadales bacterium]|nr:glycosyl hydrolase family 28-related protein [Chthonomonadales bacterium]